MAYTVNIFAKVPKIGLAKTRLAKSVGDTHAQRIAHWLFGNTLKNLQIARWKSYLYISPDSAQLRIKASCNFGVRTQGQGDLGKRLKRAYDNSPCGKIIFIGTDTPDLKPHHFSKAFRALNHNRLVFGPSTDGGFWLMGINKTSFSTEDPFANVRWSTENAMTDVIANFPKETSILLMEALQDIDDGEDWFKWSASVR